MIAIALGDHQSDRHQAFATILPNQEEQQWIVERAERLGVSLTLEKRHLGLGKLHQHKHGLMHDLLTGRVRVKVAEPAELTAAGTPA